MRLIDADALINTLNEGKIKFNADINYIILNAPTVEAERVVRCKDCKHFDGSYPMCCRFEETFEPDGYCSFGERTEVEK